MQKTKTPRVGVDAAWTKAEPASNPAEAMVACKSPMRGAIERFLRDRMALAGLVFVVMLSLMTLLAPQFYSWEQVTAVSSQTRLQPPSASHPFGTDNLGRDTLARVIWGGRESLRAGYLVVLIGLTGGTVVGLISGFAGGWVDDLIQRVVDVFLAIPGILLALSVVGALGPGLEQVMLAIAISSMPNYVRLIRGSVLEAKECEYVLAVRAIGATGSRIMFRHILPNVIGPIMVFAALGLASAIMMTAGLSYLGLGAQPPSPEWGSLLNQGREYLRHAWWLSFFPGLVIVIAVLSINVVGQGLQDAINPKLNR